MYNTRPNQIDEEAFSKEPPRVFETKRFRMKASAYTIVLEECHDPCSRASVCRSKGLRSDSIGVAIHAVSQRACRPPEY